jgi:hypothetical protein
MVKRSRRAGRATVIAAIPFPIAERLVREAAARQMTLGEVIEQALGEGWFLKRAVTEKPCRKEHP